ncbi:amidohydrolase family protein [Parafilimonas terrae]|uniref:Imidazolonepropionase n=1 Tax=Parafilimonas terrae TaxID=1465490 RepID=A0A1I5Z9Y2_9BACT|nr:amidohydrolase family protein [Parafilimonas terrae]SFQ53306.1 Imidazolonepropionase [Parafilimonas terrae]
MKNIFTILSLTIIIKVTAQSNVLPAPAQTQAIALMHATIHIGNGQVIEDGTIVFAKGKITGVGKSADVSDAKIIDCTGKQIYPGFILSDSQIGLNEIGAIRSEHDEYELGELNPGVHSLVAYNTDSKIINTVRSNGVLLANIVPDGGIISGTSSVMQLDGWNWEDAAYQKDNGIHFRMPSLMPGRRSADAADILKKAYDQIDEVRTFFREAKAYLAEPAHTVTNIKFEAVNGLFNKTQIFFVHCEMVNEMMIAIEFAKEFGFKTVIVGGTEANKITGYLKQNNIGVILNQMHTLPIMQDDDVDTYAKLPYQLQQAGVLYCINDFDEMNRGRNLMFNAGVAVGFGLTREQAVQAITLNAAKILGIDNKTGSLEAGKDANIIVSDGDVLDAKSSNIGYAFIQGRQINLDNKQKQLYERYKTKYGISK